MDVVDNSLKFGTLKYMTPEYKEAFLNAYGKVEDIDEAEAFLNDSETLTQKELYEKYPFLYTTITDALVIFDSAIEYATSFDKLK